MAETLLLGQIGDAGASPVAGGKVFYLSRDTYGNQVASTGGADSPLTVETEDLFPADDAGQVKLRRVYLRCALQFGTTNIRIAVIVDGKITVKTVAFTLPTPATGREIHVLEIPVVRRCNSVKLRITRITNTARVELLKWWAGVRPQKNVTNVIGDLET